MLRLAQCDFYDDFVQANIERLMAVLHVLEVPVLVMSATLPTSHLPVYIPRLGEEEEPEEAGECLVDTTRTGAGIHVASITPWGDSTELPAPLHKALSERERVIVYANTVARAVAYFDTIAEVRDDAILYHSRFIEPHKAQKEAAIRKMLGRGREGGVAVMTQIGEMSLNISAPIMISEACPIDRLAQRTGRMGRFSGADGTLHLIIPRRKGQLYPAPYGTLSPQYDWISSEALTATLELLQEGQRLTKADLTALTNEVYDRPVQYSPEARQNAGQLKEDLRAQWLIVPEAEMGPDDTEAATWQSRMIGPQVEVFVTPEPLKSDFDSYWSFEDARARHTVALPYYQYRKSPERFEWATINVEDEKEQVLFLTNPGEYTWERGLV